MHGMRAARRRSFRTASARSSPLRAGRRSLGAASHPRAPPTSPRSRSAAAAWSDHKAPHGPTRPHTATPLGSAPSAWCGQAWPGTVTRPLVAAPELGRCASPRHLAALGDSAFPKGGGRATARSRRLGGSRAPLRLQGCRPRHAASGHAGGGEDNVLKAARVLCSGEDGKVPNRNISLTHGALPRVPRR